MRPSRVLGSTTDCHHQTGGEPGSWDRKRCPNSGTGSWLRHARDHARGLRELRSTLGAQGVRHAALSGSVAPGDDVPESDVDSILDLDTECHIGLFGSVEIQQVIESELGRDVDLGTMRSLDLDRRDDILSERVEAF